MKRANDGLSGNQPQTHCNRLWISLLIFFFEKIKKSVGKNPETRCDGFPDNPSMKETLIKKRVRLQSPVADSAMLK